MWLRCNNCVWDVINVIEGCDQFYWHCVLFCVFDCDGYIGGLHWNCVSGCCDYQYVRIVFFFAGTLRVGATALPIGGKQRAYLPEGAWTVAFLMRGLLARLSTTERCFWLYQ